MTTATGQVTRRLTIGGAVVILDTQTVPGTWQSQTQYLLTDHLGSLDVVTDGSGAIVERASFDAWGKRRKFDWTVYTASMPFAWQGQTITRGYTFHEQLDPVGLIHMNGRVYDPELGRFMSPDIAIQDISNLQAFNAYSYVQNNPLSFTDPSGYFLSGLFKAIGNFFRSVFKAIVGIFKAVLNSQIGRALIQIAACAVAIPACIAAAGTMALAAGGSIIDAVKAMAFSFISIGTWSAVGSILEQAVNLATVAGQAVSTVTHAVVGGALSVAQGGSFMEGFASAGLGNLAGFAAEGGIGDHGPDVLFIKAALVGAAGGLAAEITGGKFMNGSITAAFGYLFNYCGHNGCWTTSEERAYLDKGDFAGYYSKACGGGDLNACFYYGVATGENPGPSKTLFNGLLANGYNVEDAYYLIKSIIPLNLANDYANLLPQSESQAAFPKAADVAQYHWNEFAKYNLPPSTFGGTPFGKSVGVMLPGLWCPLCDK